jgi:hypothetical protein
MASPVKHDKDELMREMSSAWSELNTTLDSLSPQQLSGMQDAEGWTVIDHVNHITAWERSVVYYLQGKRRYEGLGIDKALFVPDNDDAVNEAIRNNTAHLTPASALEAMRETHRQLVDIVGPMTDSELQQTRESFSSDEEEKGDTRILLGLIYANTAQHYREHLGWMKTLAGVTS